MHGLGSSTSSSHTVNVLLSMESSAHISQWRLEFPQGSVLGPILLVIYVNDLSDALENTHFLLVGDSTLCSAVPHPTARQTATALHSVDMELNKC